MAKQDQYQPSAGTYLDRYDNIKHVDDGVPTLSSAVKLNREQKTFIIRSAEINLEEDEATFLKITVPAKKRLIVLERYIQGIGLGTLSIEMRGNCNAVTVPETAFSAHVEVGVSFVQPDTTFQFIGTDIGGSNIEPHPSIGYLGDEEAIPAIRTAVSTTIPIGFLERILTNNTESSFNFGIEIQTSFADDSQFKGYFELFCTEEDLE